MKIPRWIPLIMISASPGILTAQNKTLLIYNTNFAMYSEEVTTQFTQGINQIDFSLLPVDVDEALLFVEALDNSISIESIIYYDQQLLNSRIPDPFQKYITRAVEIVTEPDGHYRGNLLMVDPWVILQTGENAYVTVPRKRVVSMTGSIPPVELPRKSLMSFRASADKAGEFTYRLHFGIHDIS